MALTHRSAAGARRAGAARRFLLERRRLVCPEHPRGRARHVRVPVERMHVQGERARSHTRTHRRGWHARAPLGLARPS